MVNPQNSPKFTLFGEHFCSQKQLFQKALYLLVISNILKRAISRILQIIPYHILLGFAARHFFSLAFLFSFLTFSEHGQQTLAGWAYKRFWRDLSFFLLFSLHSLLGLKSEIIRIKLRFGLKWSEIGWNLIGFWLEMIWDELKCPEIYGCQFWVCSFHEVEKSRDAEG